MTRHTLVPVLLAGSALLCVSGRASAQFLPPRVAPAPGAHPSSPEKPPPSLDDLLGVTPDKPARTDKPPATDPTKAELERKLSTTDAADQFKQAVQLMGQTAERLQVSKDTGLATQRLQEDILRRLDMVIHSAEQQQQQQQSSRQRQQQQQQDQQQGQNQQQQQQQGPRQNASSNPAPDTIDPPARRDGALSPDLPARGAIWGNLPERARDALLQSGNDKFSSQYRQQTEAYYRKLAEEAGR